MTEVANTNVPSSVRELFSEEVKIDLPVSDSENEVHKVCEEPMKIPQKLIDEKLEFKYTENLRSYFRENIGFLVVGIIGLKGVGKSTVANLLANAIDDDPDLESPFSVQTMYSLSSGYSHTQIGVDVYITHDRVIILDTQPLLDWAVADIYVKGGLNNKKKDEQDSSGKSDESDTVDLSSSGLKNWSIDTVSEIISLQLISFLASVCHVVVYVQDNLSDPTILRLIDRGFGWKPLVLVEDIPLARKSRTKFTPILKGADAKTDIAKTALEEDDEVLIDADEAPGSDTRDLDQARPEAFSKESPPRREENLSSTVNVAESAKFQGVESIDEQVEVRNYVNKLKRLTDYSASLLFVYNCAPVEVFLNPRVGEKRLGAYKRLLAEMFPLRLELESLVGIGPSILGRHHLNRRQVSHKQKCDTPDLTAADVVKDSTDGNLSDKSVHEDKETAEIGEKAVKVPDDKKCFDRESLTEADIVADCITELSKLTIPRSDIKKGLSVKEKRRLSKESDDSSDEEKDYLFYSGDFENFDRIDERRKLFKDILEERRAQLKVSSSVASPRLFLLPAINENGEVQFGSPSYWECAYRLQEAILSTPRRHPASTAKLMTEIEWLDFARQTWKSLSSPDTYLFDYHRLMGQDLF
ncbi:hypothetical protein Aperf_G00000040138 [Anoplocephala perfoliata]